jgi:hypothetical protein
MNLTPVIEYANKRAYSLTSDFSYWTREENGLCESIVLNLMNSLQNIHFRQHAIVRFTFKMIDADGDTHSVDFGPSELGLRDAN